MKRLVPLLLIYVAEIGSAKDTKQVQVVATHAVVREDTGARAKADSLIVGAGRPRTQVESFDLDAVIDGEKVILACDDDKGCEAPPAGTYGGELKRGKFLHLSFELPVSHKKVTRWYRIAGTWK